MLAKISKRTIDQLRPQQTIADSEVRGFRARCLPSGAITYEFRYRATDGRRRFIGLGLHGSITPEQARTLAKKRAGEVADKRDPAAEIKRERKTVNVMLDDYVERDVEARELRSADEIVSIFDRLVRPALGDSNIYDLKKSDIAKLLDKIEDENGAVMADRTLAWLRKACNWQAARDDDFKSPIVKGMARTKPSEHKRERILADEEIAYLWRALDALPLGTDKGVPDCFPGFVRALLYSTMRLRGVSKAHRDEIKREGWVVPGERMKHKKPHLVPLIPPVQKLFGNRAGFLFSSDDGKTPFSGFSKAKKALDKKITELRKADGRKAMPHWTFHDLRRTGRSIISRYATPDVAERVIGHLIVGVRGVYDLYE